MLWTTGQGQFLMLNQQRVRHSFALVATAAILLLAGLLTWGQPAAAIGTPPNLGAVDSFAVIGGQEVTNTGDSDLWGDLGVWPGTSITGFPPGEHDGARHETDAVAQQAQSDLTTAYNNVAGQAKDFDSPAELGNREISPGVHTSTSGALLTGTLTLNGQGNPNAVFIFQIPESLTTASNSTVAFTNGAAPCNVFWQIGASATIGSGTTFIGTVMALTSITAFTGANVEGRLLARNALVSLQNNDITRPRCSTDIDEDDVADGTDEDEDADEDTDVGSSDAEGTDADEDADEGDEDNDSSDEDSDEDEDSDSDSDSDEDSNDDDEESDDDNDNGDSDSKDRDSKDRDVVPYGNPATGQGGTATETDPVSVLLLTMSGLAASGAIVVASPGLRRSRKRS